MPIYEYECHDCRRRVSLLVLRPSTAPPPTCPRCHGSGLSRVMSRFATVKSEEARLESLADSSDFGDLDENDPASAARFMKKMGRELGDDLGGADISDYLDLIALAGREEEAWMALLQSRAAERVVWDLHAVPGRSPTVTLLPQLAAACGLSASVTVEERCPVLILPSSWDAYLASLSGKHRHELARKMRRLEREAPEARATCASHPADVQNRLGDFFDLHRRSRVGKARFMDVRMEAFFRRVTTALGEHGGARLWFLDTASGPIASFITLEWDDTVGLYNSGFHPDRATLSPGVVLLGHLIRDAIGRGKRRFDFLRGEERYKYEFEPVTEEVCAVRIQ